MRGTDDKQASMFCAVSPERRIRADHALRRIKAMADDILAGLSKPFDAMYSNVGRPSIPPERLLKSQILMALYTVRTGSRKTRPRVPSGTALASGWSAGWKGKARVTPSGTTGWVAASIELPKSGYKIPFLIFAVFDKTSCTGPQRPVAWRP